MGRCEDAGADGAGGGEVTPFALLRGHFPLKGAAFGLRFVLKGTAFGLCVAPHIVIPGFERPENSPVDCFQ